MSVNRTDDHKVETTFISAEKIQTEGALLFRQFLRKPVNDNKGAAGQNMTSVIFPIMMGLLSILLIAIF